jgi:cysteine desulfurase
VNESSRLGKLRDSFEQGVFERVANAVPNGDPSVRIPNISNISFSGVEGEGLLINLDMQGIAISTGSACSSGSLEPSPVIRALGREEDLARGERSASASAGFNTAEDVDSILDILPRAVENLRSLSPARSRQQV